MKRRKRRKPRTRRQRGTSGRKGSARASARRKRQWPDMSLEELTDDHLGSTDRAALGAEYAAVKQLPDCRADIGDWPIQKRDQNGGN